jgi:hypothetical protein
VVSVNLQLGDFREVTQHVMHVECTSTSVSTVGHQTTLPHNVLTMTITVIIIITTTNVVEDHIITTITTTIVATTTITTVGGITITTTTVGETTIIT